MNKIKLLTGWLAIATFFALLSGCVSPAKTSQQEVPKNVIDVSMTNQTLHISNPKNNVISNLDVTVNQKTGEYHFHADSIQDAMDPNVIQMSGDSYVKSQEAQAAGYDKILNDAFNGAGTLVGQASAAVAKSAVKP